MHMSERWGWEGADCQVSSLTMETAVRAAAVFFFRAIYPYTPPPPPANFQWHCNVFARYHEFFAGGGKSEWKRMGKKDQTKAPNLDL